MPTSDTEECFVYIQLPGSQDVVTCGRFVLEPTGVGRFVYRRKYLEDARAVEVDKLELPLREGTFETARLKGVFGALRDAAPDSWGRRVIERSLRTSAVSEMEYLLYSPEDRAGALSSRTRRAYGWQSFRPRETAGTTQPSSQRCLSSPDCADSAWRSRGWRR